MTATIQISEDGTNWVDHQGYPLNIAFGSANVFASSVSHRFLRVRVKAQVATNQTNYRIQPNMEK